MKFAHYDIERVFNTEGSLVNTVIIENQRFFYRLLMELNAQTNGSGGKCTVSIDDMPVPMDKYVEVLDVFAPFEINRKPLLSKVNAALEKNAVAGEHWEETGEILRVVSEYLDKLAFDFPCDIIFPKVAIGTIIRNAGVELRDSYSSLCEKVIDYMELVRQFDRDKLFVTVNFRSYVEDEEAEQFLQTILSHGYHILMLESSERNRLTHENRLIIDSDLCEID